MSGVVVRAEELRGKLGSTIAVREDATRVVVSPASTHEVSAVLRCCSASGLTVEIDGAGTKRLWGGAVQADVVIETRLLCGVREHSWQDLTATVGAGTPWAQMQRMLATHGQMVGLDPLWRESATVGGVLATNDSGAWRLKYGSARDLVIGMTVVLADGTVAKSGGKVVKNVAGYDLHKLMIGAFGTLAVITEVTFRLHPVPSRTEVFTVRSSDPETPGSVLMHVIGSQLSVQAVQLRASPKEFLVDVALGGHTDGIAGHADVLTLMGPDHVAAASAEPGIFDARERLFEAEACSVLKVTMLPAAITAASVAVVELGGESVAQGSGILCARVPDAVCKRAVERLRSIARASGGGTVSVLRGNGGLSLPDETVFAVMREIKQRFDPQRILNRGAMGGV